MALCEGTQEVQLDQNHTHLSHNDGPTRLLPYLYLGSAEDAEQLTILQGLGITHLLNCAAIKSGCQTGPGGCFLGCNAFVKHEGITADDLEEYDIIQHVSQTVEFINQAREHDGKVLIYCLKGINRSAALCIAYFMTEFNVQFEEAFEYIKDNRNKILTNKSFKKQLKEYENECMVDT